MSGPMMLPSSAGWTALNPAVHRARESGRADALFSDPFSVALIEAVTTGDSGQAPRVTGAGDSDEGTRVFGDYVALRTRFIDDCLARVTKDAIVQIVLLGAGLDGRAYRLPWAAKTRLFELDTAEMLEFKQAVAERAGIRPRAEIVPVAGDLTKDWPGALTDAGLDRGRPAGWVIEGLLGYLTPAENDQLMARVTQCSAPGSRLIAVYAAGDPLTVLASPGNSGDQSTGYLGRMVTAGPDAEPGPWLASQGWEATPTTIRNQARTMRRPVPPAFNPDQGGIECWLVEARASGH